MHEDESPVHYQILDTLREKGLPPQTMTTLGPSLCLGTFGYLEITVWQYLIISVMRGAGQNQSIWRWLLENGADPHFMVSGPDEEWRIGHLVHVTLVLGRERRRLENIHLLQCFHGHPTSKKYPNPDDTGIRMTLVDIIREKQFEDEEELVELVERKMLLFGDEPEKAEPSGRISEGDVDEEAGGTTLTSKAEIAVYTPHDQVLPGSEGNGMMLSAYTLGRCSAWDDLTTLMSIYRAFIRGDCGIPDSALCFQCHVLVT